MMTVSNASCTNITCIEKLCRGLSSEIKLYPKWDVKVRFAYNRPQDWCDTTGKNQGKTNVSHSVSDTQRSNLWAFLSPFALKDHLVSSIYLFALSLTQGCWENTQLKKWASDLVLNLHNLHSTTINDIILKILCLLILWATRHLRLPSPLH